MHISVENAVLSNAVTAILSGWHPTKTYKDNGWLYARNNIATLVITSDLDIAEIDFPVKVTTPGKVSLSLRKLLTGIDNSGGTETTMQTVIGPNGNGQLRIKSGQWIWNANMLLDILEPKRWIEHKKYITIRAANLRGILARAIRGMIPDGVGPVQFLQLQASAGRLDATGVCNYKMATGFALDNGINVEARTFIAHGRFGRVIAILKQLDGPVELGFDQGFSLRAQDFRYKLAGPAEELPSYLKFFIKKDKHYKATASGKDLRMAMQAISISVDNKFGGYIDFKILPEEIRVQARDDEESRKIIPAKSDKEVIFCFNHDDLSSILIGAENISIEYLDESKFTYWTHDGDELGAQFILAASRRN